jgi:hypothetical protein
MQRRWLATYEYMEIVGGEPREFVRDAVIEAADKDAALEWAQRRFREEGLQAGTGWTRVLNRCRVVAMPFDAIGTGAATPPVRAEAAVEE